jgi:abortive phage resistance protein AbiGi (putative antitoxin)
MDLPEILNRRSDLSTFLVHSTRNFKGASAKDNLESILRDRCIQARSIYGYLRSRLVRERRDMASQRTVCFTETPLEFTYLLVERIENRDVSFAPYGVAITKRIGRRTGINPIWYVEITPAKGRPPWLTTPLDELADKFLESNAYGELTRIFPFIDHMGTGKRAKGGTYRKEFWWEREWRYIGNYPLPNTIICLCPEDDIGYFADLMKKLRIGGRCIDPRWSLEKIVAHLAGFSKDDIDI